MEAAAQISDRLMTCQENEFETIRSIAAGDEEALRRLYAAYGQRLYAYALKITGEKTAAEDVLQESLVAVWQGAGRFRREGRVVAWLLGIVHHKALNFIRGRRSQTEALDEEQRGHEPLPDEQAIWNERRQLVREELACLSLEHRTVLELVFYQGLSLNEVADVCGCPVGTVKSRLNYAKTSLRGALRRAGLSAEDGEG